MKRAYRIVAPNEAGLPVIVNVAAKTEEGAVALAEGHIGVPVDYETASVTHQGPIDVDLTAGAPAGAVRKIYCYGWRNRGGVRVMATQYAGTEAAARKYLNVPADVARDSYSVEGEPIHLVEG